VAGYRLRCGQEYRKFDGSYARQNPCAEHLRYDGNGQGIEKNERTGQTLYTYDSLNRLQQAEYPTYTERFTYDRAGNRLTRTAKDIEKQDIYDVNNRLTSQIVNGWGENYRYDNAGNLLQDANNTYEYDAFRRTSKVTTKAGDVQINRYDAEGLRCEMEENGKLVQFIFNENKEVIAEKEDGNITRLIRSSDLWARESEPEKTWYHYASDEQGSTIFITGKNGEVKNRYTYDAFGNTVEKAEQIPNRYQYTGQQLDPITQQYYLRARFYNPAIARFTQEDEYHGDGLNLYAYCANNPVGYYDPSGYCVVDKDTYKKLGYTEEEAEAILSGKYATGIDDAVTIIEKDTTLRKQDVESFLDGNFRTVITNKDLTVYRCYGDKARMLGRFVTTRPATTRDEVRESLALLPKWGNSIEHEVAINIPKGTKLNIGKVGPQVGDDNIVYSGGADQLMIMDKIDETWIINKRDILK